MIKRLLIICTVLISVQLYGCPTCVGQILRDSPPFFTEEFDNYGDQKEHAEYDLLAEEHNKMQQADNDGVKKG